MYSLIWLLNSDDAHEKTMYHVTILLQCGLSEQTYMEQMEMQSVAQTHLILAEF